MGVLGVDIEDPSCSAKALVPASKIDGANAVLAQHRGAHDAGLDGDIEVRLVEDGDGVLGQDAGNGDKLGVPGAVEGAVCFVHAAANDVAVPDKDTADGSFVAFEGELGLCGGPVSMLGGWFARCRTCWRGKAETAAGGGGDSP